MAQCVTVEYKDGSKYCGESDSGSLHGYGTLVEPSHKGVFEGLWVKGSQIRGVYSWANGKQYSGDWKGPMRSGLGVETRPDGTKYSGEFSQNAMGPLGVLGLPSHGLYMGMWDSSGVQEGDGVEAYADGGFYRGQYKNGQRGGYGTRSSAGYEKSKESFIDSGDKTKQFKIHQRPTIANIMANNAMPLWSSWSLDRRSDAGALMGDVGKRGSNWKQIYQGQWINDKRCGYGVLKVSDCFTYYGQWKENTRTGYGVLVHEGHKTGKKGTKREEVKEEGRWDNGKLVEPVKYARVMKTELKLKVDEAHHEAIKAASHAREQALLAEAKANAAAAKSKVADLRAIEAQQDAESAANIVEQTVKISKETLENVCVIKGSVRITVNGQHYDKIHPRKKRSDSAVEYHSLGRSTSYSYLQLAAESSASTPNKGIPSVSSCHNIHTVGTSDTYTNYDGN